MLRLLVRVGVDWRCRHCGRVLGKVTPAGLHLAGVVVASAVVICPRCGYTRRWYPVMKSPTPAPVIRAQIEGLRRLSDARAVTPAYILAECRRLSEHDLGEDDAAAVAEIRRLATVRAGLS